MNNMIRLTVVLCVCLAVSAAFVGCGHQHTPAAQWNADVANHWKACGSCDEKSELAAHSLEEEFCTVCGAAVYQSEDGTATVILYDEQGALRLQNDYDADGRLFSVLRVDSVYDESGNIQSAKHYYDDVLVSEEEYAVCKNPDDGVYLAKSVEYFDDGMKNVIEYDEGMYVLRSVMYGADGNIVSEETHDYEFDTDGNCLKDTAYADGVISSVYESFVAPSGEVLQSRTVEYDGGEVMAEYTYKYEFADNGDILRKTEYTDGVMSNDMVYEVDVDGNHYLAKDIYYNEDGAVVEETYFDAQGNVIVP